MQQSALKEAGRVVVKVGSALLTNDGRGLDRQMIENLASQICALVKAGKEVVFVSSGAIAEGVKSNLELVKQSKVVVEGTALIGDVNSTIGDIKSNISDLGVEEAKRQAEKIQKQKIVRG